MLKRFPENSIALYNQGVVLDDYFKDYRAAIRSYQAALKLSLNRKQQKDIYIRFCYVYLGLKQFQDVQKYLKKLIKITSVT